MGGFFAPVRGEQDRQHGVRPGIGAQVYSANLMADLTVAGHGDGEIRLSRDGRDFTTAEWHTGESAGDVYVEILRANGRDFHGYVDQVSRKLTQTG